MTTTTAKLTREQTYKNEYWRTGEFPEWCWHCGADAGTEVTYCPSCNSFLSDWEAMCIVGIAGQD